MPGGKWRVWRRNREKEWQDNYMARVTVKYPCGRHVRCSGVEGMITAVFVRGKGRAYEFSYVDSDGNPKSCQAEEVELENAEPNKLGFRS